MSDLTRSLAEELATLRAQHLGRAIRVIDPTLLNFSSNNYLDLANHPTLRTAAAAAAAIYGVGAGAARLISGTSPEHLALEARLAAWQNTDAALLFNSGYNANVGVICGLLGSEDLIFSDELNHASLIDGCRLSRARVSVYRHRNLNDLERALRAAPVGRRRAIVTEGLFGMDGDQAPLAELADLAKQQDALLIVDDAHAVGAIGTKGTGTLGGVPVDIRIGTFGKALGSFGAYVAANRTIIELLINRARTFVFTTALPSTLVAASRAAVDLVASAEGQRLRDNLAANVTRVAAHLREHRIALPNQPTHILPLRLRDGGPDAALALAAKLAARGLFVHAIRPPTVPTGTSRLRLSLMATHTEANLTQLLDALAALAPHFEST